MSKSPAGNKNVTKKRPKSQPKNKKSKKIIELEKKMEHIKPYVSFYYEIEKIKSKEKLKKISKEINLYYHEIDRLQARPYSLFKPRKPQKPKKALKKQNKEYREKLQEYENKLQISQLSAQHKKYLPRLEYAFFPSDGQKHSFKFNTNGLVMETETIKTFFIKLDNKKLLTADKQKLKYYLSQKLEKYKKIKTFKITAGRYEIKKSLPHDINILTEQIYHYTTTYSNTDKWLGGLQAYSFKRQASYSEFDKAKTLAKRELAKQRKNKKQRSKRAK